MISVDKHNIRAIIDTRNHRGETALWVTSFFPSIAYPELVYCAAKLLDAGADPNIASGSTSSEASTTPLEMCLKKKNVTICQLLILAGANPSFIHDGVKGKRWLQGIYAKLKRKRQLQPDRYIGFMDLSYKHNNHHLCNRTFSHAEFNDKTCI